MKTRSQFQDEQVLLARQGFSSGSGVKNLPANAGDMGSISGLGRCPGEGNGNPLQNSCLGNPKDIEAWWTTAHGFTEVRHDLVTKPGH